MQREWKTRDYQPGDEEQIIALWKIAYPEGEKERATIDYWHWQYQESPAGPGRIRLAVKDHQIMGHYAVIPVVMNYLGEAICGSLSLDTMTHPAYQHQGMFVTLASELYTQIALAGIPLTYGFPNENSVHGLVKRLDWTHVSTLPVYVYPLNPGAIAERLVSSGITSGILSSLAQSVSSIVLRRKGLTGSMELKLNWIDQFDTRAGDLWNEVYNPRIIAMTRGADFLNWRYLNNPAREYKAIGVWEGEKLLAYTILRFMQQFGLKGGMILELVAYPDRDDALQAVLEFTLDYFTNQGVDLAACLMHGDDRTLSFLKHNRFLKRPSQVSFKNWYFCARLNNGELDREITNDSKRWYLTFGDTDII